MKKHLVPFIAFASLCASTYVAYGSPAGPPGGLDVNVVNEVNTFVTNSSSSPVPTAEQNLDANGNIKVHEQGTISVEEQRLPYQETLSWDNWESGLYRNVDFDLPEGKTLIVQTVGISAVVESGQAVAAEVTFQDAGPATIPILMTKQSGFAGSGDYYVGSMSLTGYSKGTYGLLMHAERNSATGNGGRVSFSVSGYLVDSPVP